MTKEFDERNAAKSRKVCAAMAERADTGKRKLTERERQILAMWPRFEDDEYVWFGDAYIDGRGDANKVRDVRFDDKYVCLVGVDDFHTAFIIGEHVKRHVQSVLDADGVEIKVGDTVWFATTGRGGFRVDRIERRINGFWALEQFCDGTVSNSGPVKVLTHTRPDSWELLEEDAVKEPCDYFGVECDEDKGCSGCPHLHEGRDCTIALQADLIRRAKALAGVEVD